MVAFIETLVRLAPEERAAILRRRYEKNRLYFRTCHAELDNLLLRVDCPYSIELDAR